MSELDKKTVAELKLLCQSKGLSVSGLKKAQLIQLLTDSHDSDNDDTVYDDTSGNAITTDDKDDSESVEDVVEIPSVSVDSESIENLKLQVTLAKLEITKLKLQANMSHSSAKTNISVDHSMKGLLPNMTTDAVSFFQAFEKTLQLHSVSRDVWSKYLPAHLNAKATKVYARLSIEQCSDYDVVKREILSAFRLTGKAYLERFRTATRYSDETNRLFLGRLQELQAHYLEAKRIDSFEKLRDDVLMEQFLCSLKPPVRQWVEGRTPNTALDAADLADLFFETNQGKTEHFNRNRFWKDGAHKTTDFTASEVLNEVEQKFKNDDTNRAPKSAKAANTKGKLQCWSCGGPHKQFNCPLKHASNSGPQSQTTNAPANNGNSGTVNTQRRSVNGNPRDSQRFEGTSTALVNDDSFGRNCFVIPAYLNGKPVTAYRDCGSNYTVCRSSILPKSALIDKWVNIQGVTGVVESMQLARVNIRSPKFGFNGETSVIVGCIRKLPYDVLIGNTLFEENRHLRDVINVVNNDSGDSDDELSDENDSELSRASIMHCDSNDADNSVLIVNTRARTRENERAFESDAHETEISGASDERPQRSEVNLNGTVLNESTDLNRVVVYEAHKQSDTAIDAEADESLETEFDRLRRIVTDDKGCEPCGAHSQEFITEQRRCDSLKHLWELAANGNSRYVIENGILFERTPVWIKSDHDKLLVVPRKYIPDLLSVAHDSVFGAHQGIKRTYERLSSVYSAPQLKKYCAQHVKSCSICQKHAIPKKAERFPLQPIKISGRPFEHLVIDIYGPELPKTTRGNRFILTVVCNATRYLHALPLKNQRSETVANELLRLFSFIGFPKSIKSDCQSSLNSQLMMTLHSLLGIKSEFSTPYHHVPLAERSNQTIGNMIKSFIRSCPRSWDDLLGYLCFAHNQLINPVLGEAPATLVWGRRLVGPLELLRNTWTEAEFDKLDLKTSVMQYLTELREKLQLINQTAQQHAEQRQNSEKKRYDEQSTEKILEVGSLVLLLQPTSSHKIFATWAGPYRVVSRVSATNYIIDVEGRQVVRHVNLLRPYYDRQNTVAALLSVDSSDPDSESQLPVTVEWDEGQHLFKIGDHLSQEEQTQLRQLLENFPDVFSDKPGRTHLIEHKIKLRDETPCRQPYYRTPEKLKPEIEAELKKLLAGGFIRESDSEFVSNLVVVRKRNNSIRLCTDMRLINAQTIPSYYQGSDMQNLLHKAAGSKYVSLLDLRQFYWQIPLHKDSQKYCAFNSHMGQFCWTVTPFGCKNASKTAQALVDKILRGYYHAASSFQDDLVIWSASFAQHLVDLREVLSRLRNARLTANADKCSFVMKKLNLLGHVIEDGVIKPSDDKLSVISEMSTDSLVTKKQLKSAVGLINFFREFIPNCAELLVPLTNMLKKNMPDKIVWTKVSEECFQALKHALLSKPCLFPADVSKCYHLFTDASNLCVAAWIGQNDDENKMHPVAFASRKLSKHQMNWPVIHKELYAVVWSTEYFRHLLYGTEIHLYSDHRPIQWLHSLSVHSPRIARWALLLQSFNITPHYIKGSENVVADGLSRL